MNATDAITSIEKASELFGQGQRLVETVISQASKGIAVEWNDVKSLDMIALELRKQARRFEHLVPGLDAQSWKPWRATEHYCIGSAWELQNVCELQTQHKIITAHEIARYAVEAKAWFNDLTLQFRIDFGHATNAKDSIGDATKPKSRQGGKSKPKQSDTGNGDRNDKRCIEEIERDTPELNVESIEWIPARKENQEKLGYPTTTLATYRLAANGGRQLSPYFGIDKDGRRWRRHPEKTVTSMIYYFASDLRKYQNKPSN